MTTVADLLAKRMSQEIRKRIGVCDTYLLYLHFREDQNEIRSYSSNINFIHYMPTVIDRHILYVFPNPLEHENGMRNATNI